MAATPSWPPRSAPRLFVRERLSANSNVELEGQQAHYLARVMRLQVGGAVVLCDDQTGEWSSQVESIGRRSTTLRVLENLRPREEVPDLWLCPALLKKDRFDIVMEKATELGIAAIRPVVTRRCVADKLNIHRARNVVTEAAEQCARTALPQIDPPIRLEELLRDWPPDRILYFADELGGDSALDAFSSGEQTGALLIGPEGGFDDTERAMIREHPLARPISLGPRILRGETASVAAIAVWMAAVGDWSN